MVPFEMSSLALVLLELPSEGQVQPPLRLFTSGDVSVPGQSLFLGGLFAAPGLWF